MLLFLVHTLCKVDVKASFQDYSKYADARDDHKKAILQTIFILHVDFFRHPAKTSHRIGHHIIMMSNVSKMGNSIPQDWIPHLLLKLCSSPQKFWSFATVSYQPRAEQTYINVY